MGNFFTKRVSIVIATYKINNKVYVGCHFEKSLNEKRHGKISLCAGHVEDNESYTEGAIREAEEEHGLVIYNENHLELVHSKISKNTTYNYYIINVIPCDYFTHKVSTHDEIISDLNYINNVFQHFPSNSVIPTGSKSTFLIDVSVLKSQIYSEYVYDPTRIFLSKYFYA
jgi:hypothetical protein